MVKSVRVVVGATAAMDARQLVAAVGQFSMAMRGLAAGASMLADQSGWRGAAADRFRQDHRKMTASLDGMVSAMERVANGAQSVIDGIDQQDARGAAAMPSGSLLPAVPAGSTPATGPVSQVSGPDLTCVPLTGGTYVGNCGAGEGESLIPIPGLRGTATHYPVQVWRDPVLQYAQDAGVDPVVLMATVLMESRKAVSILDLGGRSGYDAFQETERYLWDHGLWPATPAGPSMGITNVKPGPFQVVANAFPAEFKGVTWDQLAGNDALDIKVAAYYLRYLQDRYLSTVPDLRAKYTPGQLLYGIYNGGESNYQQVLRNGGFGKVVTENIRVWGGFIDPAGRIVAGPDPRPVV